METGTCCLDAYLRLFRPLAPITAPRETDHSDGQFLRGALHAESKNIAERLAGFGCVGWKGGRGRGGGERGVAGGRGGGAGGSAAGGGLLQACRIVSTGFLQLGCQNEMKAELMRSQQNAETLSHRDNRQYPHGKLEKLDNCV